MEVEGSRLGGPERNQNIPALSPVKKSYGDFNTHISNMISHSNGKSSDIDAFVKDWLPGCSVREISNFMRISGKKSMNESHLHLKRHLPSIASRIENLSSDSWRPIDVAAALYGLQCLSEDDDGYLTVTAAMTVALTESIRRRQAIPPQSIAMAMVGLQNNRLRTRQSLLLLDSVTAMVRSCHESLRAWHVSSVLCSTACGV
jgi:hypothetical protein